MSSLYSYKILTAINSIGIICFALITITTYAKLALIKKILSETTEILECQSEAIHLLTKDIKKLSDDFYQLVIIWCFLLAVFIEILSRYL